MTPLAAILALGLLAAVAVAVLSGRAARRLRGRLQEAERRADQAVRARDGFFDLATHELRSPLAAILGYQELLQDGAYGDLGSDTGEPITRIGRSARHLLHLIDGVVELSRLRAGGVVPDIEPVNTAVLMSGIADAFRSQTRDRGIEPRVDIPRGLPTIGSDPDRLLRALDLFLASAIKHPDGGSMSLDVRSDGVKLQLRIHPTDISVPDQPDDPELRLGIRLAVAGRVAELLGGGLDLETDDDGVVRALRLHVRDLLSHTGLPPTLPEPGPDSEHSRPPPFDDLPGAR
ncbi:MAG: HAMP domain-containing histidine kinase [Gemmatimonadetes bacterium]|nr:HAMP domain-containing histidine kinase [Gemmatimonadota bacterium]